jgi:UDP-N-acetyl-D-glucosamine dehydrogenase
VNIALANELALMCDRLGVSSWEVIEAAASKPFAFMAHYPGPGLGGDCIPVVPRFPSRRLREYGYSTRLIDAAHEINAYMPIHVVSKIADALNSLASQFATDACCSWAPPTRPMFTTRASRRAS